MSAAAKLKMDEDGFYPIVSSNLHSARYDASSQKITVRFKNGTAYEYPNCRISLWNDFSVQFDGQKGRSAGKFLNAQLKPLGGDRIEDWK